MRGPSAPSASKLIFWHETEIIESWKPATEDHEADVVDKTLEKGIGFEEKEFELDGGRARMMEDPAEEFVVQTKRKF